ncbi:tyrosine-protein kinase receptor Tie-1-like [Patiria miniata]|uniref:receptor protein-tyrosine kinase n=1 Tax=Patiria miniata TaxID=46514 RepID=A0A914ATA0_PATMI|nr:tyrosine-protein kinase receptor Tie-1-like [Patiria miniata]
MEVITCIAFILSAVLSVTGQHHTHSPMVTPTPYGAGSSASISCFRSDSSVTLSFGRPFQIALPGSTIQTSTTLPTGSSQSVNGQIVTQDLTTSVDATGLFYCEIPYEDSTTRMYSIIHSINRRFEPADGLVTKMVNKGDSVTLSVNRVISGGSPNWRRTRNGVLNNTLPNANQYSFTVPSTDTVHGDLYTVVASGTALSDNHFSMIRLIVRGCAAGKWGPPNCGGVCDMCYNGGVCDDETGDCICPPGFFGTSCIHACPMHSFGWFCSFRCGAGNVIQSCTGSQFGLPDPYGNSCIAGYHGRDCNTACTAGSFGAGCTQTCHCQSGQCDAYTGRCQGTPSGCQEGWSGMNCRIPDVCPVGYYGVDCLNKCYCNNNAACDKGTGYCIGSNGVCATGFVCVTSSACSAGFYGADCSRSCHCLNNAACHPSSQYCGGSDGECAIGFQSDSGLSSCLFGIVGFRAVAKSNPGQSVELSCAGSSGLTLPVGSITLSRSLGGSNPISYTSTASANGVRTNTFSVPGLQHGDIIYCTLNNNLLRSTVSLHVGAFYELPVLSQPPSVSVSSTSATVNWQAWGNVMDTGDGPVVSYKVHYSLALSISWMAASTVPVTNPHQTMYSFTVQPLQPNTAYLFSVAAVREGPGGEGPRSTATRGLTTTESAISSTISTRSSTTPTPESTTSTPESTTSTPEISTTSTAPTTASTTLTTSTPESTASSTAPTTSSTAPTTSTPEPTTSTPESTTSTPESTTSSTAPTTSSTAPTTSSTAPTTSTLESITSSTAPTTSAAASTTPSTGTTKLIQPMTMSPSAQPIPTKATNSAQHNQAGLSTVLIAVIVVVAFVAIAVAVVLGIHCQRRRRKRRLVATNQFVVGQELTTYENQISPDNDTEASYDIRVCQSGPTRPISYEVVGVDVSSPANGRVGESQPTLYEVVGVNLSSPTYDDVGLPSWAQQWSIPWEDMIVGKKVLGKGNFGEVRDGAVMVGGEVPKAAIKTLKSNASEIDRQNFMEEFRTLTKIGRHPNVVGILGACQHEDILYVALEFMPTGDLLTHLRNARSVGDDDQTTLSSEKLIQFALDVAKGMQHLAACGVIHRDLAARNILLDSQLVAKVSDFGLSRGEDIYVQMSMTRVPTRWLSLESLVSQTYTSKSDVWSFGILLWEVATLGATPYEEIISQDLMTKLENGYRMPKPSNCDDEIYNLMLLCWQEDPANRPDFTKLVTRLTNMADKQNERTYLKLLPKDEQYMYMKIRPDLDGN